MGCIYLIKYQLRCQNKKNNNNDSITSAHYQLVNVLPCAGTVFIVQLIGLSVYMIREVLEILMT